MKNRRIEKWKDPVQILTPIGGGTKEQIDRLAKLKHQVSVDGNDKRKKPSISDFIDACKELIYDIQDGQPVFHAIMYTINASQVEIEIAHMFDILIASGKSQKKTEEEILHTLAIATAFEVPVYPNTEELAPELARYHRDMLIHGFTASSEKGGRMHLKLTRSPGEEILESDYIEKLDPTQTYLPADITLIRQAVTKELKRRDSAAQLLAGLEIAIVDLETILSISKRNESKLQNCLTNNPILFGTQYVQILPKHKLGAEYEMDYALVRSSGLVDLMEIEASNLKLYTKSGNPTSYLVHAEQQVFDWLSWIEHNSAYAREGIPGIMSPKGYVIIGRNKSLTSADRDRLIRRNTIFRGQIEILTYEDLLGRAQGLLSHLQAFSQDRR